MTIFHVRIPLLLTFECGSIYCEAPYSPSTCYLILYMFKIRHGHVNALLSRTNVIRTFVLLWMVKFSYRRDIVTRHFVRRCLVPSLSIKDRNKRRFFLKLNNASKTLPARGLFALGSISPSTKGPRKKCTRRRKRSFALFT